MDGAGVGAEATWFVLFMDHVHHRDRDPASLGALNEE